MAGNGRRASRVAQGWWDFTTLDEGLLERAASLGAADLQALARPGFAVRLYDTL